MKKSKLFLSILLIFLILAIALDPKRYITCALNGLSAWTFNVLPCIFPFMLLTRILIELGAMDTLCKPFAPIFERVYGTSKKAGYVFCMSILAGYPVGSKMTADLYESGQINLTTAYRMSSFCSNSGPMFIIGTVGSVLFKNPLVGLVLFVSHFLSALLNGLLYRRIKAKDETLKEQTSFVTSQSFGDIVSSSVQGVLNVGGIICLFFIIIEALSPLISLFPPPLVPLFEGMIELTRGCIDASALNIVPATLICSFLISFGGFSTILQSMAMLKKLKMPVWLFSVQKFTQGIISMLITLVFVAFI